MNRCGGCEEGENYGENGDDESEIEKVVLKIKGGCGIELMVGIVIVVRIKTLTMMCKER